ncbi:MAG TPA: hypothetical protein VGL65_04235 [Gemmatimonadales bacterium]
MIRYTMVLVAVLAGAGPAAAQVSIAGRWTTDYPTAIRNENGEETVVTTRRAVFDLALKGDSVTGTWTLAADSGGPAATPLAVHGARHGTGYLLQTDPVDRHISVNGDESTLRMATRYQVEVHGDALAGSSTLFAVDGSMEMPDRAFAATRVKP